MASDHQVALTRSQMMPAPSTHISKAARQVVAAFIQKLYEMVDDPNNEELIRWSEVGDSFFILDHERFAREVLGRWFKHRNFSSFVRQLNMYGFHKTLLQHLQQGVLESDTDTEFWNFAHANFHRGQPDLLCLIQRKKRVPQPGEEGAIDLRDPNATAGLLGAAVPGTGALNTIDVLALIAGLKEPLHIPLENFSFAKAEELRKSLQENLPEQREMGDQDRMPKRVRLFPSSMSFVLKKIWDKVVQFLKH